MSSKRVPSAVYIVEARGRRRDNGKRFHIISDPYFSQKHAVDLARDCVTNGYDEVYVHAYGKEPAVVWGKWPDDKRGHFTRH